MPLCSLYISNSMLEPISLLNINNNLLFSFAAHVIFFIIFYFFWSPGDALTSGGSRLFDTKTNPERNPWNPKWVSFCLYFIFHFYCLKWVCFCLYFIFHLYCLKWLWQWHELYPKWSLVLSASLTLSGEGESVNLATALPTFFSAVNFTAPEKTGVVEEKEQIYILKKALP